jgi:predicted O-linked N-acetylglucosamine transferase (SPINDLY family)
MGLPVLTLTGNSPPSRAATSLLTAAGLAELAVPERGEFIARAVRLAQARRQLREMREHLRNTGRGSPLFDACSRVRNIEAAYRRMASRARDGLAPASFELPGNGLP